MKKKFTVGLCLCLSVLHIATMDRLVEGRKETKKQFIERSEHLPIILPGKLSQESFWDPCNNRKIYMENATSGALSPFIELRDWEDKTTFKQDVPLHKDSFRYNTVALSVDGKKVAATRQHYNEPYGGMLYELIAWKLDAKQNKFKLLKIDDVFRGEKNIIPWRIGFNLSGDKLIVRGADATLLLEENPKEIYTIFKIKN